MTGIDDLFEEEARRLREEAEKEDNDPSYRARREAKRAAEAEKMTRPGVVQEDPDPEDEEEPCGCEDRAPADGSAWQCPDCDAEWGEND